MTFGSIEEIGRPLKVSEMKVRTVVVVSKGSTNATMWVIGIYKDFVHFGLASGTIFFIARRTGENNDSLRDDADNSIRIFEYLGEV